ncbi:MAG: hypothetical protein LQ340_000317 [Diploschistes diacapsis]|nr:MAG: hypothetical protein LQ340_000317 [Diploschistes diacapsis]
MASATVHTTSSIEEPTPAQEHFTDNYDLDHPIDAIQDYARLMFRHTKVQMDNASTSSRRRAANDGVPAVANLSTSESTDSSIDSVDGQKNP